VGRFFLTTPIYYVNDAPHVGHAYTTVNADAIARWHRLAGDEVFFMTGTDEHGAKVAESAAEHGMEPKDWADRTAARFADAWRGLDIAYDDFIRTSEPRHYRAVQEFLTRVYDNGYIEKGIYSGLYCVRCEDYYTEEQLVEEKCPIHKTPVTFMEEENYFFKLDAFGDRLLEWYGANPEAVRPASKRNEALGFIKGGLRPISITRTSLSWGVPVPWDDGHVFYVWYDALINYLTAIGYGSDEQRWRAWWPHVHHLIGKEILRFHCVWWPAMCMAAGIDPPANVFVHGWLLFGGERLSKTMLQRLRRSAEEVELTDVAPDVLTDDFGVDPIRYHLLRVPLGSDSDFSYDGIVTRYNAELANNLGNLAARVATVVGSKCGGFGPAPDPDSPLAAVAAEVMEETAAAWGRFAPHEALGATWRLIGAANSLLETTEPWRMEPGPQVEGVLGSALEALRIVTLLASPAMPATARELWRRIGLPGAPEDHRVPEDARWGGYPGGLAVTKGEPLFPRRRD
jgi:methionyl-tRNA synthetase